MFPTARFTPSPRGPLRVALGLTLSFPALVAWGGVIPVTSTADSGGGSLRSALAAANANPGADTITFAIPRTDPGFDGARGVFRIAVASALPVAGPDAVVIDGATQTAFGGDTNPAVLGAGGTVGAESLPLPRVAGPEIELYGGGVAARGLALAGSGSVVRGMAIYGFTRMNLEVGDQFPGDLTEHVRVEACVIGSRADAFALPADAPAAAPDPQVNISLENAIYTRITNNLIGFSGGHGIEFVANSRGGRFLIEGNELRGNGRLRTRDAALRVQKSGTTRTVIRGNLITDNAGGGLETRNAVRGGGAIAFRVVGNTIANNGYGDASAGATGTAGILIADSKPVSVYTRNVVADNYGAGVSVVGSSAGQLISENVVYGNGRRARPADGAISGQVGIDLSPSTGDAGRGAAPFVTPNDDGDADAGPNGLLNFPVLTRAALDRTGALTLEGFAPPGAHVEVFAADAGSSRRVGAVPFGQGRRHVFTVTEGGGATGAHSETFLPQRGDTTVVDPVADLDGGRGAYASDYGVARAAQRFRFVIPANLLGALAAGDSLVATAVATATTQAARPGIDPGSTSEFSNAVVVLQDEVCDNGVDDDGDGLVDCEDPDCGGALADAGPDRETCPGEAVTLTATAGGAEAPVSFSWNDRGAGELELTVAPTTTTQYVFTATNAQGCPTSDTATVRVVAPAPTFAYVPPDADYACRERDARLAEAPAAIAVDGCGDTLAVAVADSTVALCGGSEVRYRTYTATDARGQTTRATRTLSFGDLTPPTFAGAPADVIVNAEEDIPPAPDLLAVDDCAPGSVAVAPVESRVDVDGVSYELVRTWTHVDPCGNRTQAEQIVLVNLVPADEEPADEGPAEGEPAEGEPAEGEPAGEEPQPLVVYGGFSPNGDGLNDVFQVQSLSQYPGTELLIYNRWGTLVFRSYDYDNSWDGSWYGARLPDGTYYYIVNPPGLGPTAGTFDIRR